MKLGSFVRSAARFVKEVVTNLVAVVVDLLTDLVETTEWATGTEEGQMTVRKIYLSWQLLDQVLASISRQAARRETTRQERYRWQN